MSRGPGKWQQFLLALLTEREGFILWDGVCQALGRGLTRAEYSAIYRAASMLARRKALKVSRVWTTNARQQRTAMVWIARLGIPTPTRALTGYEERKGAVPGQPYPDV